MNNFLRRPLLIRTDLFQRWSVRNYSYRWLILICILFLFRLDAFAQSDFTALRNKIAYGSAEEKRNALFQIRGLHSEEASSIAIPALADKLDIVRATAVSSVIFLPPDEALRLLLPLLNDNAEFVRRETAYALGELSKPAAASALINDLRKEDTVENRSAAAIALGKLGNAEAVDPLLGILKKKPSESEEFIRRSAARSIGEIAQTIRFGTYQTTTPRNFLPDKFKASFAKDSPQPAAMPHAFDSAAVVLGQVIENRRESDDTRREAAFALGAIGSSATTQLLKSCLDSEDYYLVEICKEALLSFAPAK